MDRIKIIPEKEAAGELKRIYKDIRRELRFPWVPYIFQAFAPYPDFMRLCWKEIRPLARHRAVEYGAAQILRHASNRVANELHPEADIRYLLDRKLQRSLAEFHRQLLPFYLGAPRMLVWVTRIHSWFYERLPGEMQERVKLKPLPFPNDMGIEVKPIRDENASRATRAMFEQIRLDVGSPITHTAYRVLARSPEFFEPAWASLREVLRTPMYRSIEDELREVAGAWVRELPRTTVTPEKIQALPDMDEYSTRLLSLLADMFYQLLPGLVIHLTYWGHQLHAARARGHM